MKVPIPSTKVVRENEDHLDASDEKLDDSRRFDRRGLRFLKDGDEVGDFCPACGSALLCRRMRKLFEVYCRCDKVHVTIGDWAKMTAAGYSIGFCRIQDVARREDGDTIR